MHYADSILDLVGDTPLVRISRLTRDLGPADRQPLLLAKLEMLNPGGSVKDRIGLPMIEAAERAGPAASPAARSSSRRPATPATASRSRPRSRATAASSSWPTSSRPRSRRSCARTAPRSSCARPTSPPSRPRATTPSRPASPATSRARSSPTSTGTRRTPTAHERTTGPEIWAQTEGRITHLVASVGTGGTVTGIARYLKAQNPALRVIGADPEGSVLSGDTARPYLTEGVGEDFFPGTYDARSVDRWVRVSDRDAFAMARRITREEGILAGESCGTAMLAALDEAGRLMREEPATAPDAVIVVILPDGGRNYLSKLYNDEWMRANSLLPTTGAVVRVGELLEERHHGQPMPDVVLARTTDRVGLGDRPAPASTASASCPVSEQPDGTRPRGDRRLGQREGPARPRVPQPGDRRADGRRGDGPAAADARRRRRPSTRRSRCCPAARRRCS